jgi:hypothetical protein
LSSRKSTAALAELPAASAHVSSTVCTPSIVADTVPENVAVGRPSSRAVGVPSLQSIWTRPSLVSRSLAKLPVSFSSRADAIGPVESRVNGRLVIPAFPAASVQVTWV